MKTTNTKIYPCEGEIQVKFNDAKAGDLVTSSRKSAVEVGEVVAVGEGVTLKVKKGDMVFVKAWAVDTIYNPLDDKDYHFISEFTHGVKAVVK